MNRKLLAVTLVLGLVGFGCTAPMGDHAIDPEDLGQVHQPVTCSANLTHYPVFGPHNGGWDRNALDFTCPPHPSSSPDNSDFIAGDHFGNDIFGKKGIPIVAGIAGTVVRAGYTNIGGHRVTVEDACGWHTYYAHLDSIASGISVGVRVQGGQVLGTLGNTGSAISTAPHLHFSIYPESYEAGINPFPLLEKVDHTSCEQTCEAHCEGSEIIDAECGRGDCAAYVLTCADDSLGVRCVSVFCDATGQSKVCVDEEILGECDDGALSTTDCPAGSGCVDDDKGARCVASACLEHPNEAHDVCLESGNVGHCNAKGVLDSEECPEDMPCAEGPSGPSCGGIDDSEGKWIASSPPPAPGSFTVDGQEEEWVRAEGLDDDSGGMACSNSGRRGSEWSWLLVVLVSLIVRRFVVA